MESIAEEIELCVKIDGQAKFKLSAKKTHAIQRDLQGLHTYTWTHTQNLALDGFNVKQDLILFEIKAKYADKILLRFIIPAIQLQYQKKKTFPNAIQHDLKCRRESFSFDEKDSVMSVLNSKDLKLENAIHPQCILRVSYSAHTYSELSQLLGRIDIYSVRLCVLGSHCLESQLLKQKKKQIPSLTLNGRNMGIPQAIKTDLLDEHVYTWFHDATLSYDDECVLRFQHAQIVHEIVIDGSEFFQLETPRKKWFIKSPRGKSPRKSPINKRVILERMLDAHNTLRITYMAYATNMRQFHLKNIQLCVN